MWNGLKILIILFFNGYRNEEKCPIDENGRRKDEFMGSSVQPAATSGLAHLYASENNNNGPNNNNGGGGGGAIVASAAALPPPSYNESFQHQTIPSGRLSTIVP